MKTIDISQIDLRLKSLRIDNRKQREKLLISITQVGVLEPCLCIDAKNYTLLDGFKRFWCAKKLALSTIPVTIISQEESSGIVQFLRDSKRGALGPLEQASILDELRRINNMGIVAMAQQIDCSPAWVSIRLRMIDRISPIIREAIFSGKFPVRSYMYTLCKFTRVNKIEQAEIDKLVLNISGKNLSSRDADKIIEAYFSGNAEFKKEICSGNPEWVLTQLKTDSLSKSEPTCRPLEKNESQLLKNLNILKIYIIRISKDINSNSNNFLPGELANACSLARFIDESIPELQIQLRTFYDKRRN